MKNKKIKNILYEIQGKKVPLSFIKKVWDSRYLPPLTPELITKWFYIIKNEKGL